MYNNEMKHTSIVTLLLLFVISFQIVHEFTFSELEETHCSIEEYVEEINEPTNHGDICDIHFEYHISYLLPINTHAISEVDLKSEILIKSENFTKNRTFSIFRPPIIS